MTFKGRTRRLRERMKLTLPVRVSCRESEGHEWTEMSRLVDVTPFGARFGLTHQTEPGRLLQLTMPLPRQLRCFDHVEDQYRVWALVRNVRPHEAKGPQAGQAAALSFEVGVAFVGKHPPASFVRDPATRYEVVSLAEDVNLWRVREREEPAASAPASRGAETRLQMAVDVLIEVFDERGQLQAREQTVTENLSRHGAAVWTTLQVERGRFVRVSSTQHKLSLIAAVRARRTGADSIPRLHLEFIDKEWPLEGLE